MSQLCVVMALGFLLGLKHATDSDHLVAMSTLVSRTRQRGGSWILGVLWGLGHTLTIFAVGILIILLKVGVLSWATDSLEFLVGVMLVGLGVINVAGIRMGSWGIEEHSHEHEHEEGHHHHLAPGRGTSRPLLHADTQETAPGGGAGQVHESHVHMHAHSVWLEGLVRRVGKFQLIRSFGVGMVHGLAGSTAVALLILAAIPQPGAAMIYLVILGLGSLVSMAVLSASIEWLMFWIAHRAAFERWFVSGTGRDSASGAARAEVLLARGTGMVSFCFGLYIMYKFGFR